jgi:glycosyltransferase involved in cell wall biosynthesis
MRIGIVNWSRQKVGGTETYLEKIFPELIDAGHQLSFLHEAAAVNDEEGIQLPAEVESWCVSQLGESAALSALREWNPNVLFLHSVTNPHLEAELLKLAPAVFLAHAYYGTCISGNKSFKFPIATPCDRKFGLGCLAHYYPHRCGGLNPLTMMTAYRRQALRLEHLSSYERIVTLSRHMRDEYIKHGFSPQRVQCISYLPRSGISSNGNKGASVADESSFGVPSATILPETWRLLFLGRIEFLKGGSVMLDALPAVVRNLNHPVHLTVAGGGSDRQSWQRQASRIENSTPGLKIDFVGWASGPEVEALWENTHLFLLPSVWPEPFGLVGLEAGTHGIPSVAFSVGGIPDWLHDGINGHLAASHPPGPVKFAEAIVKCLRDPATYAVLRDGALRVSKNFSIQNHVRSLIPVLADVAAGK